MIPKKRGCYNTVHTLCFALVFEIENSNVKMTSFLILLFFYFWTSKILPNLNLLDILYLCALIEAYDRLKSTSHYINNHKTQVIYLKYALHGFFCRLLLCFFLTFLLGFFDIWKANWNTNNNIGQDCEMTSSSLYS